MSGPKCPLCGYTPPATAPAPAAPFGPAPAAPAPTPHGSAAAPAPTPRPPSIVNASEIVGSVRRAQPPHQIEPPANLWKGLTIVALVVGLFPVGVAALVTVLGVWLGFAILRWTLGFRGRSGGGGTSLFDVLLFRRLGGGSAPEKVPVYIYEVDTGATGIVQVKQVGDLAVGAIMVGQDVDLRVRWTRGEPVLLGGHNRTTGTPLALPSNPWKVGLFLAVIALAVFWAGVFPAMSASPAIR